MADCFGVVEGIGFLFELIEVVVELEAVFGSVASFVEGYLFGSFVQGDFVCAEGGSYFASKESLGNGVLVVVNDDELAFVYSTVFYPSMPFLWWGEGL